MAIPHEIQRQLIRKRLIGKEGKARLNEIRLILAELPGYNNGPYGKIKDWLAEEIRKTKVRSKIKHQDWLGVKKEGIRQFVLVGLPSSGKSSLVKELSGLQTKVAAYEFTTLKPLPAVISINNAKFQLVDLPGLIEGASEDVGGGKRLLGIVRGSDGIILMHDLSTTFDRTQKILNELEKEKIKKPMIVIGNKIDLEGNRKNFEELKKLFPNNKVIGLSTLTREGFETLKDELWSRSNLIRVYPSDKSEPMILERNSKVESFIKNIHKNLLNKFGFAIVSGTSVKFAKQRVGLDHILEDKDVVEVKFSIR
jgi:small GTP-binding protein